ncbi:MULTISPECIES: FKBP-type peptidyl-prolyl cis-trans isomerase [unclassified Agarivorans]|uniref:FKBP-type peptidyl-prolyl cis-trans isomerase n=1 Tax=unclassified Agarivorans TaxID=2636026 RepID=UPI0026E263AC|nr:MULTISPECIES: FKBP-type peptidyl-prolyl cis-trans isomerase [unclassified Agarivorans]MDO6685082.1 FKBP-type peptidyl-prolyl cis-trans isomerase [Agarivorans sp. 3_MG-2023]MDO6715746.1 FKBP-type peptidyl-prolyl cis-trans isomerase [Agarivorans sp. 2_MG-2023]
MIQQGSKVELHFVLKLSDGTIAESTYNYPKPAQLVVGDGSLTEGFERCLEGLKAGDKSQFELSAEQAFGPSNPDNIKYFERSKFGEEAPAEEGSIIAFAQPDGSEIPGIVREVTGDSVTVDFNHPLAGQTVIFEVEILAVN